MAYELVAGPIGGCQTHRSVVYSETEDEQETEEERDERLGDKVMAMFQHPDLAK